MTIRIRDVLMLLLGAAWLAGSDANAQAHGPPATEFLDKPEADDPASRAARLSELDAFLRRLIGRYRDTQGVSNYSERMADCAGIGTGPGVQCMLGLESRKNTGGGTSALLFGLDTGTQRVNFLRVNPRSIAEGGFGRLSGDTLYLKFPCVITEDSNAETRVISCENRVQFRTVANSDEVAVTSVYIKRVLTRRGVVETEGTQYTWLKRFPAVSKNTDAVANGRLEK